MIKQPKLVYPLLIFFILTPQIFTAKFVSDIISAVKNKPTLQSAIVISSAIVLFTISLASFIALVYMVRNEQREIFSEIQNLIGEHQKHKVQLIISLSDIHKLVCQLDSELSKFKDDDKKNFPASYDGISYLKKHLHNIYENFEHFYPKTRIKLCKTRIKLREITEGGIGCIYNYSGGDVIKSIIDAKLISKIIELKALINGETYDKENNHKGPSFCLLSPKSKPVVELLKKLKENIGNLQEILLFLNISTDNMENQLSNIKRSDNISHKLCDNAPISKNDSSIQASPSSSSSGTITDSSKEVTQYSKEKEASIKSKYEELEEQSPKKRSRHVSKSKESKVTIERSASVKDTRAQVVEKSSFSREGNVSKSFASNFKSRKRQKNKSLNGSNNHAGKPNSKCNTKWQSITSIFSKERAC